MLEYLIVNNRLEAAKHFSTTSATSWKEQLVSHFNKGNREQFMQLFSLLRRQSKLQFYLRVYFLIYNIHPALRGKTSIPEPEKMAFKDFLDTKGSELAKTNEFLEFYALPYNKKPHENPAYKNLFKKEWVSNLKQKLETYITQEQRLMKAQVNKLFSGAQVLVAGSGEGSGALQQKVKQMEKINKKLFEEVKQISDKYLMLEEMHKSMSEGFQSHMMQAQSKWFQITKQLVSTSKTLIEMLVASNSNCMSDKRFIKAKKRTQKYERFVNRKFDDLLSQSQDISIFDRPSINELSYSVTPYTQKSFYANQKQSILIESYLPLDYKSIKLQFKRGSTNEKISIINGFFWTILKSKPKRTRKMNIMGLLHFDVLGFKSGEFQNLLISRHIMKPISRLIQLITLDSLGKKLLFDKSTLHKDLIGLITQCNDPSSLEYIMYTLAQISSEKSLKLELINYDIIEVCLGLLRSGKYEANELILENITAILLNMLEKQESLRKFEAEKDIFDIIKKYMCSKFKLTKVLICGALYALLESQELFRRAQQHRMADFINAELAAASNDPNSNKAQLIYLKNKIATFQPKEAEEDADVDVGQLQAEEEDDDYEVEEEYLSELEQLQRNHEHIIQKFSISGKDASKQAQQIKELMEDFQNNKAPRLNVNQNKQNKANKQVRENKTPQEEKNVLPRITSPKATNVDHLVETPYIKNVQKQKVAQSDRSSAAIIKMNNYMEESGGQELRFVERVKKIEIRQYVEDEPNKPERRMQKSISADRGINRHSKEKVIYQSNNFNFNKVSEFKAAEEKSFRSPQQKKSRGEVLKQLNEQLKAEEMIKGKKKVMTEAHRQSHLQSHMSTKPRKNEDPDIIFQSRPLLRRTPPKD